MKRQLFVAQLPVLLEQRTAQNRLGRQSLASGLPWPAAAQLAGHQAQQRALSIQPQRHRLQLAADLVPRKNLEYRGLDDAFRTHGRLRWCGLGFWIQWLASAAYRKPPDPACTKPRLPSQFQSITVYGRALARLPPVQRPSDRSRPDIPSTGGRARPRRHRIKADQWPVRARPAFLVEDKMLEPGRVRGRRLERPRRQPASDRRVAARLLHAGWETHLCGP